MTTLELGKTYRDAITGIEGVAIGYARYLTGCDRVLVETNGRGESKSEEFWFDVTRLVETRKKKVELPEAVSVGSAPPDASGGPQPTPPSRRR